MDRRSFVSSSVFALARLRESLQAQGSVARMPEIPSRKGGTMLLGCQSGSSDRHLRFFKRHGVNAICGNPPDPANGRITASERMLFPLDLQ